MSDNPHESEAAESNSAAGDAATPRGANYETAIHLPQPVAGVPRVALRPALEEADGPIVKPTSDDSENGAHRFGRYLIYGEIARGGMGAVLRAHDQDLGRDLAMKVLLTSHRDKPEMMQRFMEEAQIAGQLQHPGIVPVYELSRFSDLRPFFTMKLVKGKSLAAQLRDRGDLLLDRPRFLRIFLQVCETIAYAHSRGVIHRDLKPSNVMVGAFGEVQVMDWGLAKVLSGGGIADEVRPRETRPDATIIRTIRSTGSSQSGSGGETRTGSVLGTPAYMPPEQAAGDVERLDERSDVFGLGAILCEVLTGRPPYDSPDHSVVHRKAIMGDLREAFGRLDACSGDEDLIAICKRCLSAERDGRPRDAGALARELSVYFGAADSRLREAELTSARLATKAEEERKRRRVSLALAATILLAVSLVSGGLVWLSRQRAARDVELAQEQMRLHQQVNEALTEATGFEKQARANPLDQLPLTQARDAVRRAEALLVSAPDERELTQRTKTLAESVERQQRERNLMKQLDAARAEGLVLAPDTPFGDGQIFRAYEKVFASAGIDRKRQTAEEAAKQIRSFPRPLQDQLAIALLDWSSEAVAGMGVILHVRDGKVFIQAVAPHSAADEDGKLLAGDEIIDASSPENDRMISAMSMPLDEFSKSVLTGPAGRSIRLRVRRASDGTEEVVELVRGKSYAWLNQTAELAIDDPVLKRLQEHCQRRDFEKVAEVLGEIEPETIGPAALLGQLRLLLHAGAPNDVMLAFGRRVQAAHPQDYWLNVIMGVQLFRTDQTDSLRYLQAALAIRPDNVLLLNLVGAQLGSLERHIEAESQFRRGLAFEPDNWLLKANRAETLGQLGRVSEAVADLREVTSRVPSFAQGHGELGRMLAKQGEMDEAIKELRLAVDQSYYYSSAYVNLGICLFDSGDTQGAMDAFRRAIEGNGADAHAYFNLGGALLRTEQIDPARAILTRGLQIAPDYIQSKSHLGKREYLASLLDDRVLQVISELERQTSAGQQLVVEGQRLLESGQPQAAVAKFRDAVTAHPGHSLALRALGESLAITGDEAGAIGQFAEAVRADPTDLTNHRHLLHYTASIEELNQFRTARAAALAQFGGSNDPVIMERIAKACLLLADDHDDVRTAAKLAIRSANEASDDHWAITYLHVVKALGEYRLGEYEAATKSARKALSFDFDNFRMNVPANAILAMAEHHQGNVDHAKRQLFVAVRRYRHMSLLSQVDHDYWFCETLLREAVRTVLVEPATDESSPLEMLARGMAAAAERRFAAAALDYERALAASNPELARRDAPKLDWGTVYFQAAAAAAEAAQARGKDAPDLNETKRDEHLARSHRWLRRSLDERKQQLPTDRPSERTAIGLMMSSTALAILRDPEPLAKQHTEQREVSKRLWTDLQAYHARLGK